MLDETVEGQGLADAAVDAATRRAGRRPDRRLLPTVTVREVRGLGHGSSKWHTARVIARQRVSAEAREGFAAFDEKRKPGWAPESDARRASCGIFGRSEPEHHHSDEPVPGWDAINAALAPIYGDVDLLYWGRSSGGGWAALSPGRHKCVRADGPPPHWHFVSYGLSGSCIERSPGYWERSGWIKPTFRVRRAPEHDQPPQWALGLLQNLARYVLNNCNVLELVITWIYSDDSCSKSRPKNPCGGLCARPQLGRIDTPHGAVAFLQVVGLTMDEYDAVRAWDTEALLELIRERDPLMVTDLDQLCILGSSIAAVVKERTAAGRSSMAEVNIDRLAWEGDGERLTVTIGALGVERLGQMVEGRLPFGRTLLIRGEGSTVVIQPAETFAWHDAGEATVHISLPIAQGRDIVAAVQPIAATTTSGIATFPSWS